MKNSDMLWDITVARVNPDSVVLCWSSDIELQRVEIFRGTSPENIDMTAPAAVVSDASCARVSGLSRNERHYFRVVSGAVSSSVAAERRIPLEGTFNFRDLGGYRTSDGRTVKWGRLFRSDNLSHLSDDACRMLTNMGIRLVCDFRSDDETNRRPDRIPEKAGISYLHLPVTQGRIDGISAFERLKKGDTSWFTDDFMRQGYLRAIEDFSDVWGRFVNRISQPTARPAVFHCSAGKDRAGIAAALVLLTLGVPEEAVVEDHQLSNAFIADVLDEINARIRSYGVDPRRLAPYFSAPPDCMEAVLDRLRADYGSAAGYLTGRAGVSRETIERLRSALLE